MRAMIDGQRFFLRAFQTSPLAERIDADRHARSRRISAIEAIDRIIAVGW